ncbi:MAG: hypothetical protein MR645_01175 [Paraprevotella sp.]|nr:hypothetical protein [Paraprevotella sp.]
MEKHSWCYNHENLFRLWLDRLYNNHIYDLCVFDYDSIFKCWQKAKEYALEIANSEEPELLYKIRKTDMFTNFSHNTFLILDFLNTMLRSSKNKNLESFANFGKEQFKEHLSLLQIDANSIDEFDTKSSGGLNFAKLKYGKIESDYDYSLPDGGIKDETKTDETKTITETETDETITKTKTKTDGSVMLPDVLDTNEFKKYLSLAKENGLIKDVNGKLEWIQIGNRGGDSQLAYFLGRAFGYIHSENGNNGNEFPGDELDELFGVTRIYRLLVQVHRALRPQKWRRKIDELFE